MAIEISAFAWVPPFASGHVRDLRPRWALEEAGLVYKVRLLTFEEKETREYRAWQPFGQVPAYRDDEVRLFESGAILLRIASLSDTLRPRTAQEQADISAWLFAALNSIEPMTMNLTLPALFHAGEPWVEGFRPHAEKLVDLRLKSLSAWLKDREWLTGRFGVADIMMATVLRDLREEAVLTRYPVAAAYLERCLARPAFRKALDDQIADHAAHAPAETVN
ncbi:glutathione S-transferase family protein [Pikeienuella piscinae]|uniref:Glutathione S-transferase family protein n=1 Tax=Pikeienuella piscinae TaxID=2748098 RepID=A0A7M3T5Q5_9RHOB|nr:glutathione S-transferase family protein [Pikeienuella piscinae]QIE57336.1 glutathione S-transferase family protein [Pikeienuella piscinae]